MSNNKEIREFKPIHTKRIPCLKESCSLVWVNNHIVLIRKEKTGEQATFKDGCFSW